MLDFLLGFVGGGGFIYLLTYLRHRQMLQNLAATIVASEARLAVMSSKNPERAAIEEQLDLLRRAQSGSIPMEKEQRTRIALRILPSLGLLVALVVVWLRNDQSTSSYALLGFGIGALLVQVILKVRLLFWRPSGDSRTV